MHRMRKPVEMLNSCRRTSLLQLMHCLKSYGRIFSCFVVRWALDTDRHFLCPRMLLPVGVQLSHSVLRCRNSHRWVPQEHSRSFRSEAVFGDEHTFCSRIHSVSTGKAFAQLAWAAAQHLGWLWLGSHGVGLCSCRRTWLCFYMVLLVFENIFYFFRWANNFCTSYILCSL
jgi:hypothetical protein